ncbi:MAG: ABC transporter substrate-binding protein [Firmicutes bacterium]|nr:ABC transporter substrate-binding protein [Bacillota bacterium]
MIKKVFSILIVLLILFSFAVGCAQKDTGKNVNMSNQISLTDMAGRTVTIPNEVKKVFSAGPEGTILLYTMDPDKMIGWNYELREGEKRFISKKYHNLPNLGGVNMESINVEEVLRLAPDIVIMMTSIDDTSISKAEQMEKKLGKSVFMLDVDINKLDSAYRFLGKILNNEKKAEYLANYCRETMNYTKVNAAGIKDDKKVKVYYAEGPIGLQTEPSGAWHAELIDMVGGNNVAKVTLKGGKGKSEVSIEQLLTWNPDLIISWDDERGGFYSQIFKEQAWKDIKAVRNREVYEIPNKPFNWFDRPPSVNRILGLKWMGNLIYPEIFKYNMDEEIKKFYSDFYHYELSNDEVEELLKNSTRH